MKVLRIATRKSPLAVWQAEHVGACLQKAHPALAIDLVRISTRGDKLLDTPLAEVGGKGLFVKELERALMDGRADIAAHSMKDVPAKLPDGLDLPVIMAREDPHDAFVSNRYEAFTALPAGALVGTCSVRRKCQLLALRPDLNFVDLRGNVSTRLGRLDAGAFDALILASAGLRRLGKAERIRERLPADLVLPAIGQGAIGVECRRGEERLEALIAPLSDSTTASCVRAERAMNALLGGGCQIPVAGFGEARDGMLRLRGLVGSLDGSRIIRREGESVLENAESLGRWVGESLLAAGARAVLDEISG